MQFVGVQIFGVAVALGCGGWMQYPIPTEAVRRDAPEVDELERVEPLPIARRTPLATRGTTVFAQDVPGDARQSYECGLAAYRRGELERARGLLFDALAQAPTYADANVALGIVEAANGAYAASEAALAAALRSNPRDATARLLRASALVGLADAATAGARRDALLADAASELDRAWELCAHTLAIVRLQKARVDERRGDRASAARELEAFLDAVPNAPNARALREAAVTLRGR